MSSGLDAHRPPEPRFPDGAETASGAPPRRTVCLYTRSANPSGMGVHMVDLLQGFADRVNLVLLSRSLPATRSLQEGARAAGAVIVDLPSPHDPAYAGVVADALRSTPVDLFHGHAGWGWEDAAGFRVARERGVASIVVTHHLPYLIHDKRKARRMRKVVADVDARIAVSEGLRRSYERVGPPESRWYTVPNGVRRRGPGPGRNAARSALGIADDALVVMNTGRLVTMKGQRYLVEATAKLAAEFPSLVTVILGVGDLADDLRDRAARLGVADRVLLAGHRPDARMLLDAADVFALPSRSEGMPLAALEAMDAGLPVVGTRVIGTDEVVIDGTTGLLVRSEDAPSLAAALRALLADARLRAAYGAAGTHRYREEHTVERMVERTWAVYERVLSRRVPRQLVAPTP